MEASNLMGGFVASGDEDDEWDINIFFSDENHKLDLGLQTSIVVGGDQYPPSSSSSSHDHDHNHNHNQVYFPANQAYNYNNGGGDDDYCYFDQPGQEKMMNLQQVMQIDDINDFFVPDFSDGVLATESINDLAFVENHEGYRHHDVGSVEKPSQLIKRKFKSSSPEMEGTVDDESGIAAVKKKPRVSKPAVDHQKVMKNEPRRRRKLQKDGDDQGKMPKLEQGSSSDDHDTPVSNKAAPPASKAGAATIDSQSLYARKRREKINERLKILQNLVPNGTKVDISTMLEEAVIYVKFLQLQIKLLSSEDMWMYAPIAYNGMDIGRLNQILPL